MNKIFKHKIFTGIALAGALFLSSACTDEWDDHYSDQGVNSNQTLLDVIKADSELSDFYAVVEACGVSDSLLNQSRVYTLWAPVNGTFNRDSLINKALYGARDTVLVRFVEAHIANYLHPANGAIEEPVLLLNDKVVDFVGNTGDYKLNDIAMDAAESNVRLRNGILHKIARPVEYLPNIWEYLALEPGLDSLCKYLYSFNRREFNEYGSIQGPTVNGEVTYIDSAFINSNMWFSNFATQSRASGGFGDVSDEDSSYVFFALTNDVWNEWVPKVDSYYRYSRLISTLDSMYLDSMRQMNARKALCNYLVYSEKTQKAAPAGKMIPTFTYFPGQFEDSRSLYKSPSGTNIVRPLFDEADLMRGVTKKVKLSNGTLYVKNEFTFSPYDLWLDAIKVEGEHETTDYLVSDVASMVSLVQQMDTIMRRAQVLQYSEQDSAYVYVDSIFAKYALSKGATMAKGGYLEAMPVQAASRPKMTVKLPGTLSTGKYRIGVVVVPPYATNPYVAESQLKPSKIRAQLYARAGANGTKQLIYDTSAKKTWSGLQNDPTRLDTLYLYDVELDAQNGHDPSLRVPVAFTFDYCEAGLTTARDIQAELVLTCDLQKRNDDVNFERTLRIDCVFLEPIYEEDNADTETDTETEAGE